MTNITQVWHEIPKNGRRGADATSIRARSHRGDIAADRRITARKWIPGGHYSVLWRTVARHGRRRWALLLRRGATMREPALHSNLRCYERLRFVATPCGRQSS